MPAPSSARRNRFEQQSRAAARNRAWRLGGGHRHQHPSRLSAQGRRRTGAHLRTEAARRGRHALRDAVESGDVEREFRAAQPGAGGDSHLQRPAPAVVGAEHRPRRNQSARAAAGLVDHAGQDQSGDSGTGGDGFVPGDRLRHGGGAGGAGRPTRAQRHDADHGLQRAHVDHHHDQHAAAVHRILHQGHHGQRSSAPTTMCRARCRWRPR